MSGALPPSRAVRSYHVFDGATPVLDIDGRPGRLYSMALLPPGMAAPEHPFLNGVSHEPFHEHALRNLLLESADFDDYVDRLVGAGFDIAGNHGESVWVIPPPALRLGDGPRPAVALWRCEGQLSSLRWQPEGDAEVYPHALATAYDPDALSGLRAALLSTQSFDELVAALAASGLRAEGS